MEYFKIYNFTLLMFFFLVGPNMFSQIGSKEKKIEYSIALMKKQLKSMEGKHGFSNDSLRIEVMNRIAALYIDSSKDSSLFYANLALTKANLLKQTDLIAVSYHNLGKAYDFYKDSLNAETNYQEWYKLRKTQGGNKFRWALQGMREFYSKYSQIDKLEKIEEEWINILDKQYHEKQISPWLPYYSQTPVEDYRLSMYPVLQNLIGLKAYFLAEKLFVHMVKECPDYQAWTDSDMLYFQVERKLISDNDTAALSTWYNQWFNTLKNYCPNRNIAFETLGYISEQYIGKEFTFPNMPEKYYQKILNYTYQLGSDSAVYQLLSKSLNNYYATYYERFKFNLFAIQCCIRIHDAENIEKHYSSMDYMTNTFAYNDDDAKYKVLHLLSATEKATKDARLRKWCNEVIKKLK
jgi:hypothetical protein